MSSPSATVAGDGDVVLLSLELRPSVRAASLARAAITGLCERLQLAPSTIATATLLVSELVTNAVVHPEPGPAGEVRLRARLGHSGIRIEVSDDGSGFTPKPRDPQRLDGGYGLHLLEQQATRWGVEPAPRTTVWFEVTSCGAR
ncbi:MAG: ATP-binding protein [Solirubrobacteraceae bacterium]